MTMTRALTLAAAAAAVLTATGCPGKTCNDATPPVKQMPAACTAVTGQALSIPINTCPKCDQGAPSCDVRVVSGGGGTEVNVEPVSEVCDPNSSCPIPDLPTCAASATQCVLTAQMIAGLQASQTYNLNVLTDTGVITKTLTVASTGAPGCTY